MYEKLMLPKWLSRGIEEYFPMKSTDQTFAERIDDAEKNNRKLRVKLGIDPTGTDICLLYTSPSPRDGLLSRMPSSA